MGSAVRIAALVGLAIAGCRHPTSGEPAEHRVEPTSPVPASGTGLTFPLDPPSPTKLVAVPAFGVTFDKPLFLTAAPDGSGRLFIVEQAGRVKVVNPADPTRATVFLDIRSRVRTRHNEEGLLGFAFAPDYAKTGVFYVNYSASKPRRIQISRMRASSDPARADPEFEESVLRVDQPYGNHNGGMLAFGPDAHLYIGFGDGGAAGDPHDAGQDLSTLLGKILRVEVDASGGYHVPPGNPFEDTAGARPEIWAYGLRNPWRFSFDRQTGDLWAGDVGQDAIEEIDLILPGRNYGWRLKEGTAPFSGRVPAGAALVDPVVEYGRDQGQSVTGGYVYRGTHLPAFRGAYFYGDFVTGKVWALSIDGDRVVSNEQVATVPMLASFGEDSNGELYAVSHEGTVFRFEPAEHSAAMPAFPTKLSQTGLFKDTAALVPSGGLLAYSLPWSFWSDGATKKRWLALPKGGKIGYAQEGPWSFPVGTVIVKQFDLPLDDASPERVVRLETRAMVHEKRGWAGYTYRWNKAQTDAELVTAPTTETFAVTRNGKPAQQDWYFPAGSDCLRCHTATNGPVLGIRSRQLSSGGETSQLVDWIAQGLFENPPATPSDTRAYPSDARSDASAADKARAYLAVNCAICHHRGGPAPGSMDFRHSTPVADMNIVGIPAEDALGLPNEMRVQPGAHASSSIWGRVHTLERERMPPLATTVRDEQGLAILAAWIDQMKPLSPSPATGG